MADLIPLKVPFINANEDEALLVSLECQEKQAVRKGDALAVLETTKSSMEIIAEQDGYIVGLMADVGDVLKANQILAYIADNPDASPEPLVPPQNKSNDGKERLHGDLRITEPALQFARDHKVDLSSLPTDQMITTTLLKAWLAVDKAPMPTHWISSPANESGQILVYGAGGHGRSLVELIRLFPHFFLTGFVDDGVQSDERFLDLPVLGGKSVLETLFLQGIVQAVNGVGGIGNPAARRDVFILLNQLGFFCPTVVHPSAVIEKSVQLAHGVQVFPLAYVGSQAQIGFGSIINTSAIVSHDCVLGEMVNLSPGATLAGGVSVGDGTLIGMRSTVNLNVQIGKGARIGNGATVKEDVPENGIVPAGAIWPLHR